MALSLDDFKNELTKVQAFYDTDMSQQTLNALIYGKPGTGKTNSLKTCRKPVLVSSFDPGGSKTIRDEVGKGIFIDSRFERDDERNPTAYRTWADDFEKKCSSGFFSQIGTYCIDSFTMWNIALMAHILKTVPTKRNRPDVPAQQDYQIAANMVRDLVKRCASLPCDFILTAHIASERDEVTGGTENTIATYPSLRVLLPALFDEVYVSKVKTGSSGSVYTFQTNNDGIYVARTRLGSGGRFQKEEPQDFKALLKKGGLNVNDKEWE